MFIFDREVYFLQTFVDCTRDSAYVDGRPHDHLQVEGALSAGSYFVRERIKDFHNNIRKESLTTMHVAQLTISSETLPISGQVRCRVLFHTITTTPGDQTPRTRETMAYMVEKWSLWMAHETDSNVAPHSMLLSDRPEGFFVAAR